MLAGAAPLLEDGWNRPAGWLCWLEPRRGCGLDEQHPGHRRGCRWMLAGASPLLVDGNRRGLISWHHQGAARLSVAEDAGAAARLRGWAAASGHRPGCNKLAASQEPAAAINAQF